MVGVMVYPQSGWYMASTSNIPAKYNGTIGVINSLSQGMNANKRMKAEHGIYRTRMNAGVPWCLDNGAFVGKFDETYWLAKIEALKEYLPTCLFVVIPDVIGNSKETLEQFSHYRNMVKDFPVALVSQDGIKEYAGKIQWDDFDCLFIGGSDEHKLGKEGGWILNEAKKRNKWIHIGRVNSGFRMLKFWQADSWDGSQLRFQPDNYTPPIHAAVLQVRAMKQSKGLFDDLRTDVFSGDYSC
jgi:hypothetical protein